MTAVAKSASVHAWTLAARPKTLPASMVPVLVGTAIAYADDGFAAAPALAALVCSMLLQIGVNLANDYFDFRNGPDTTYRTGPLLAMQTGLISEAAMKLAIALTLALCAFVGAYLVLVGGLPILVTGAAAILVALAYSGGPWPLGAHGMGDLLVFIFFGVLGVCGTYYVQTLEITPLAISASLPVGFLITAIIVVNNIRDIRSDRHIGKKTLAVMIGENASRTEYIFLVGLSYLFPFALMTMYGRAPWALLPLVTLPMAVRVTKLVVSESGPALNEGIAQTAKLALFYGLSLAAGIILS